MLIYIRALLKFIGFEHDGPITVETDNKGAYDLCHRFTSAQHSRHIDRKLFKMREMRGAGVVTVGHVETKLNPADIFTKITDRQTFERHRATVLGLAAAAGAKQARRATASTTGATVEGVRRVSKVLEAASAVVQAGAG